MAMMSVDPRPLVETTIALGGHNGVADCIQVRFAKVGRRSRLRKSRCSFESLDRSLQVQGTGRATVIKGVRSG